MSIPTDLLGDGQYDFSFYPAEHIQQINPKYLDKTANLTKAWHDIAKYLPELINHQGETQYRLIDLSTGCGALLTVAEYYGHRAMGTDFFSNRVTTNQSEDCHFRRLNQHDLNTTKHYPFKPIVESEQLNVFYHDGNMLPYPFKNKEFDLLTCFQAIEMYGHPDNWDHYLDEFVRITKHKIVLRLNKIPKRLRDHRSYVSAWQAAMKRLRAYDRGGFKVTLIDQDVIILEN